MMEEITRYTDITQKKTSVDLEQLSDAEALIRALDLMDFYAALRSLNPELLEEESEIEWIELTDVR